MIPVSQIQLNVVRAFTKHVQEQYPDPTYESKKLLLVLQIYEWHLVRFSKKKACIFDELSTLKHGVRQAELFIVEIAENPSESGTQLWAELLQAIVMDLTEEIAANEALYPEMKPAFDRERARYRQMKQDAEEAELHD
jgi:hypothetical protein